MTGLLIKLQLLLLLGVGVGFEVAVCSIGRNEEAGSRQDKKVRWKLKVGEKMVCETMNGLMGCCVNWTNHVGAMRRKSIFGPQAHG